MGTFRLLVTTIVGAYRNCSHQEFDNYVIGFIVNLVTARGVHLGRLDRITHPRSLGKPDQTKEEYVKHTGEVISLCTDFEASYICSNVLPPAKLPIQPTIHSIIEAPGGKVVTHVRISTI